jgi:hypothetical protein
MIMPKFNRISRAHFVEFFALDTISIIFFIKMSFPYCVLSKKVIK